MLIPLPGRQDWVELLVVITVVPRLLLGHGFFHLDSCLALMVEHRNASSSSSSNNNNAASSADHRHTDGGSPPNPPLKSPSQHWPGVNSNPTLRGHSQPAADSREEARTRDALNLAPRRRMLSRAQLAVVWLISGYAGFVLCICLTAVVMVAVHGGKSPSTREMTDLGTVIALAFIGLVSVAGWIHVSRLPHRIAQEDDRLRRLDLGLDGDGDDTAAQ
jgi:hypothetical protein